MKLETVGQLERATQDRVVNFFRSYLGYEYMGNWKDDTRKSPVENDLLFKSLEKRGYGEKIIKKAITKLEKIVLDQSKSLYDINKEVYSKLRYGVKVKEDIGENNQTLWLIDWENIQNNHFAIAEEVTVIGQNTKRPDIVIYVNGIALGIIELKRSKIGLSEGIRQNLDNQKKIFIKNFFSTIQFVMAGNDTEGLKYGCIKTPEKYYLGWKEESDVDNFLDRNISQICNKERFLELIHDFIVFDKGVKKICRQNQYFGVKEAQKTLKQREGGIIWHTQGSGKSLTMVWLTKWIIENINDSRILIITDREELDSQIQKVFLGVNEDIYRTKSGKDLIKQLNNKEKNLICSLVHKFGNKTKSDEEYYVEDLKNNLPSDFEAKGDIYVFVDECHRTQSGKLHDAMKLILPNAIFVGFTGTPLLKKDKSTSLETFGKYIHTYKFDEAVKDKVVLDLRYEARDIDQKITSQEKIDMWFESKTRGLTDYALVQLKKKWGTLQRILSSKSRLTKIISDILLDFETKPRLSEGSGNAMLVAGSIYEACKYYELFQDAGFKKCAIISSYNPSISSIKGETVGGDEETENIEKYETYRKMLGHWFNIPENEAIKKIEDFEKQVKKKFIEEPGQMKLLIVVDKLLTGFDAPPATYLYIDKSMKDHGLFQAITRVNRLDGESKEYGYIIDYKDLFGKVEQAIGDYTSGAFEDYDKEDVAGLLTDRLEKAKEKLDEALETVMALCEGVGPNRTTTDFIHYFVGKNANPIELKNNEQKRHNLYKYVVTLIRAYANIANEMQEAGYTENEALKIKRDVKYYSDIRDEIKLASGDYIDLKAYEPAMRHLIDSYISAEESKKISAFDDISLLELVISNFEKFKEKLPERIRKNQEAMAETIENNIRKLIIDEQEVNPRYYEQMSKLLDEIIKQRREQALEYQNYLKKIVELAKKVKEPLIEPDIPSDINTVAKKALYDNLGGELEIALKVHETILKTKKDGWKNNKIRQRGLKEAIIKTLKGFYNVKLDENIAENNFLKEDNNIYIDFDKLFEIIKNQKEY